jgi:hypothetical protein
MKKLMTEWRSFLHEQKDPLAPLALNASPKAMGILIGLVGSILAAAIGDYIKDSFVSIATNSGSKEGRKYLAREIFKHFIEEPDSRLSDYETVQPLKINTNKLEKIKDLDAFINLVNSQIASAENPFDVDVNNILDYYLDKNNLSSNEESDWDDPIWGLK